MRNRPVDYFVPGFIVGMVTTLVLGMLVAAMIVPDPAERYNISVCEYLEGELHGDVCVKDGRVLNMRPNK